METISAIYNQQLFLALLAASRVIQKQDSILCAKGKGLDLSKVPAFYGTNFPAFMESLADSIPMEDKEKAKWIAFMAENIKIA